MARYSIPGQERWVGDSKSDQYPEEPVIIVHYYTIPPISSPAQWQTEEDVINDLVGFDFSSFSKIGLRKLYAAFDSDLFSCAVPTEECLDSQ